MRCEEYTFDHYLKVAGEPVGLQTVLARVPIRPDLGELVEAIREAGK